MNPLLARCADDIIAFTDSGAISVATFVAEAKGLAAQLPRHSYVINLHVDRYQYLRAFCAAIIAGQCTLMPPNRKAQTLDRITRAYPDSYIVGESGREPAFEPAANSDIPAIADGALCAVAFTSGSTGEPQANKKCWDTLREGALSNVRLLIGQQTRPVSLLATVPPQHMWGMETSILLPLFAPIAISARTPFFPQDIVEAINELPEPVVLVSSPIHLETLLKSAVKPERLSKILTATAPLSRELSMGLESTFHTTVLDVFGCTESGILATRNTSKEELWTYADCFKLEETGEGAKISAEHLPEDVFLPDKIELMPNQQYRWLGRKADIVNIAGKRESLTHIGQELRKIPGVLDAVVFVDNPQSPRLRALVVAPDINLADISAQLREVIDPVFIPRPILSVNQLPRQGTGKIAASAVQELYEKTRASD